MNPDNIVQPHNFVVKVTELGPIEAKRTVGTYVGKTVGPNIDEALNTVGKTVGTNDEALKTVGETVGTNDEAFKAVIVGTSIEDLKNGVQIAMSQPLQPAPSTPLSPRPPPPPLSPRPPPPTSPPPANESLYKYELTSQTLVDRSTILDRSLLPSHRQSQPTAVSQSTPQSQPTAVPQSKPQEPDPEPAVDERQLGLYRRMRSMLNLSRNGTNARSYISRYGTLSENCPFGERVWDGLHQDFIGYRFSDHMTGRRFLGWFLCPTAFSQENAGRPAEPGDSVWYPAVFCDVYWSDGEYVYMACLHIILIQCRAWKVHRTRIIIVVEMMV